MSSETPTSASVDRRVRWAESNVRSPSRVPCWPRDLLAARSGPICRLVHHREILHLIAVGKHVVLADEFVLQVGHPAAPGTFRLAFVQMQAKCRPRTWVTTVIRRSTASVAGLGLV